MKLQKIFPHLKLTSDISRLNVKGVSDDSRRIKNGDVFFVKPGEAFDIFSVLKKIEAKAVIFVVEDKYVKKITECKLKKRIIFVKNINKEFYEAVDMFYGFDKDALKFIGITGTKGKTTTAFLIRHVLIGLGEKASLIGTIKYMIGDKVYEATHTTPDYLSLRRIFSEANKNGSGYMVMEVSSHAIHQNRIRNINFSRCVFTNLSREHLDYHKTMSSYFAAKKSFFLHNTKAISIINKDDKCAKELIKGLRKIITYGIGSVADFEAKNIVIDKEGVHFTLVYKDESYNVTSHLLGRHNIYNILAAITTVFSLGFALSDIIKLISNFEGVEGRLQEVSKAIFVDYAHSPDSLEKALSTLRDIGYEKIVCVFGCGGNRDKGKRKIMGNISSKLSDFTFITSDNPRNEDPVKICSQIASGFNHKKYSVIPDRKNAITEALKLKRKYKDACLLIAGKGHENYQIIGSRRIAFKDSEVVRKLIKQCL